MNRFLRNPNNEIENIVEILNNTLYFAALRGYSSTRKLKCDGDLFYFSTDDEFTYQNYYCDFGPLNISCLYKYCTKLNKYLQYAKGIKGIVHYTCSHPDKKANAAFLMGSYCIIYLKMEPKHVLKILQSVGPFKSFLDASQFVSQFTIKLIDCYQAIEKASTLNFFNFEDFNSSEYDLYNKLEYGDINWLIPRKFLAFIGPADNRTAHPPEFYIKYFLKNDIKTVIRLNNVLYDAYAFMQVGIQHYDLIFPDGTTPPKDILLKFLYIAETAPGAIGVHCKAGLGRTGSLIGAYLIKHYRMTAREAIAWMRICRPGSVIGQQQIWLEKIQSWLWRIGSQYRLQHYGEGDKIPRHKYGIYSKAWPLERERLIREARKHIQTTFTRTHVDNFVQTQQKRKMRSVDRLLGPNSAIFPSSGDNFKKISKLLSSVHGMTHSENKEQVSLMTSVKTKNNSKSEKCINCVSLDLASKNLNKSSKKLLEKEVQKGFLNGKPITKPTQGDKLNEIKAYRNQKNKIQEVQKQTNM